MPNLLAMSFEGELAPSFDLLCLAPGRTLPDGWGLGYYPGSVTKRELPEFLIPEDDPEAIGRAEYAQSLSMSAFASIRLHWDATNGVRNNRFTRL